MFFLLLGYEAATLVKLQAALADKNTLTNAWLGDMVGQTVKTCRRLPTVSAVLPDWHD